MACPAVPTRGRPAILRRVTSRRRTLVAGALVCAIGIAWWALAGRALDRVEAEVGAWRCRGTDVQPARADGVRTQAPALRGAMSCRTRLRVTNDSGTAVTLGSLLVPVVGDQGGPGVRLVSVDGRPPRPGVDAVVDFGQRLGADTSAALLLAFAFRHDGCTDGGTFWMHPQVKVSAWGRSREVVTSTPIAFRGTPESDCWGKLGG